MACFIVPATEAIVTTAASHILKTKKAASGFTRKLRWLNKMLWGGSGLLAFEHIWNGEIIPEFPFLTNAANPADMAVMLEEMATSGVGMALLVTGVWGVMLAVSHVLEKRPETAPAALPGEVQT